MVPRLTRDPRVILIGGTSHTGKSTVARLIASRLDWTYRPTDKMARHPGRPWPIPDRPVPPHVAEHYLTLSVDELIEDVVRHYTANVWPQVIALVEHHTTDTTAGGLVIEGSAVLPELAARVNLPGVASVWFSVDDELLRERLYTSSRHEKRSSRVRAMIEKFLARAQAFNNRTVDICERLGLVQVEVVAEAAPEHLANLCLAKLGVPWLCV